MMNGIIISITEEEFQARLEAAMEKALEKYRPKIEEVKYITRKEAAKKLRISLPTLNEYTKTGRVKGYRISGRVLYRSDEIESSLSAIETLKYR